MVRQRQHRVRALLGLDPGVRRAAVRFQHEVAAALARADDIAVLAAGLQHQRDIVLRRQLVHHGQRGAHVGLFIAAAQQRDRADRAEQPQILQRGHGVQRREQPALVVGAAGAKQRVALDPQRARGRHADRVDRIEMRRQQHPQRALPAHRRRQAIAGRRVGPLAHFPIARRQPAPHPGAGLVHAGLGGCRALDRAELAQIFQICRQARFQVGGQSLGFGGNGRMTHFFLVQRMRACLARPARIR